uniref:Uncharacterized protein n=1 Tax=Arundo donax TaxID=35708 RepID=A0A0A9G6Y3_ARUDO
MDTEQLSHAKHLLIFCLTLVPYGY